MPTIIIERGDIMSFDGIMMHKSITLLQQEILGGRVNKIYQVSKYELLIQIRAHRKNQKVLLSCHPTHARLQITYLPFDKPQQPNMMTMLLKKHLEGAYLREINQIGLDRICCLVFTNYNEIGILKTYYCYIEIMGKHSNIIITAQDHKIMDCIKHITPAINPRRIIQPGATYSPPPTYTNKVNPFTSPWISCSNLTDVYEGVSPILSREIIYRIEKGESFEGILEQIKESQYVYIITTSTKQFFHCLPLTHIAGHEQTYDFFEGLDTRFHQLDEKERIKQQTSNILKFIQTELQKNTTKLHKLEQTLFDSQNYDQYRILGELLLSNSHLSTKGRKYITIRNYYTDTDETITLDPRLDVKQNAQKYFVSYRKAKNSMQALQEQIQLTQDEITYFDGLLTLLQNASYQDALEMKEELEKLGYLKKQHTKQKKAPKKPRFEQYLTKDHIPIYIGKNNLQNEYLTCRFADRFDTWFHVKDMPGSHVVVKGNDLSEDTIRLASALAAYYSKATNSNSVPVNYTLIKNVKKLPGGKPGQVLLKSYQTIYIDPDIEYLEQLTKIDTA